MDCMLDFVVDLAEERVDLGGSQFSESVLERWYFAHASQQNVAIQEFGSPRSPRSALFARDLIRHGLQLVASFFHEAKRFVSNVECFALKLLFRISCSILLFTIVFNL